MWVKAAASCDRRSELEALSRNLQAIRLERRVFDPVDGVLDVALTYWPKGGELATVEYRLRVYTASELRRMAHEAGFAQVEFYGDPEGGSLSRETRLVLVGRT
jgi:hypothetical protein